MGIRQDANGKLVAYLQPRGYAPGNCPEGSDMQKFAQYSLTLVQAHVDLMKEDAAYAARFASFESDVVSQLGLRATLRQGRELVRKEGLRRGILTDILARAGPAPIETIPYPFSEGDRFGNDELPFSGSAVMDIFPEVVRESVVPFHYCQGAGSITISGGDADRYVRAHRWLRRHDREYAKRFDDVVAPFVERAEKVDRFDFEATTKITDGLRRALVEAGIAERIERRVESELSEKGDRESD